MKRASANPLIAACDLRKSFGTFEALRGVSLAASKGDVVGIIGASGSGKSTLLRCLNLLEVPSSGSIQFDGVTFEGVELARLAHVNSDKRVLALRKRVGMVFQSFNLWPHRTALENVMEGPLHVLRRPVREAREQAEALLAKVGLSGRKDYYPRQMSGGQQQRVAIARALALDPDVMLFDEPTSALDPELVGEVLTVMRSLAEEGRTMLVVTHEIAFAGDVASRLVFMANGEVAERGDPRTLLTRPETAALTSFLTRFRNAGQPIPAH